MSDLSDVQVMQLNALFLVVLSVTIPMAARSLFGPMPFPAAFLATEAFKVIIIKVIQVSFNALGEPPKLLSHTHVLHR